MFRTGGVERRAGPSSWIGDALRNSLNASARRRRVERPTRRHRPPEHRVPAPPPWGRLSSWFLSWRVHLMALSWLRRSLKWKSGPAPRTARKQPGYDRFMPGLEPLAERIAPAISASFSPVAHTLSIFGDNLDNRIT